MVPYYYNPASIFSFGRKTGKLPPQWWKQSRVYTLHKPVRRHFPTRKTLSSTSHMQYQADLIEMIPFARENRGFKYILVVIDIFSRQLWAFPLKNKTGPEVANAFSHLFQQKSPMYLQTDHGKEFHNSHVRRLLTKKKVKLFSTNAPFKASMAERVNRTLKSRLWKYFTFAGNHKWHDVLQDFVDSYNNTPHRSLPFSNSSIKIHMTPMEATDKKNWHTIWQHQEGVKTDQTPP